MQFTKIIKRSFIKWIIPFLVLFSLFLIAVAETPPEAVKFVILKPNNSTVGIPVTVTIEAQRSNNQIDTDYQDDVTLVTSGSATGGGLVDIINGVGAIQINDYVAETVILSLSDTESTGLDVSSTQELTFKDLKEAEILIKTIWNQNGFWFRDDDGDEAAATGFGTADVVKNTNIIDIAEETAFRLRFSIKARINNGSISPQIEFKQGGDCDAGDWTVITPTSDNFNLQSSSNFNDGDATTKQISTGSFVAGQILDSTNPATSLDLPKNKNTEYEWSLKVSGAIPSTTEFAFRITNGGQALNDYSLCPTLTTETPSSPPSPPPSSATPTGGGCVLPITLKISGKAYPGAQIVLAEKSSQGDKLVKKELVVSENGDFEIAYIGIPSDYYAYGLLVKDKEGRQTQTKVYNIDFTKDLFVVKDVFVPPTTDVTRAIVTKGDFVKVAGFASPNNKVKIELDNDITYESESNEKGNYQLLVNTARLSFGRHSIRVKQEDTTLGKESDFSLTRSFLVSNSTVPKADFSGDGKIDIKDWSIFLAFWKEKKQEVDLDGDGKVNISDLSIFLRAVKI